MNILVTLDHALLQAATKLGGSTPARDVIVFALANVLPLSLVGAGIWLVLSGDTPARLRRNREVGVAAVVAVLLAVGVRSLIANSLARPRPFAAFPEIHHLAFGTHAGLQVSGANYSFPSGHATMMFAFTGTVFFMGRHTRLAAALLIISLVVIISRVVAGFHYPSDVVGGALLGLAVGALVTWQSNWIEKQLR